MMVDIHLILLLLFLFQTKHLLVDFFLQNAYMLGKFNVSGWFFPLMAHTSMHGVASYIIAASFGIGVWHSLTIAIIDVVLHTVIDKIKVDVSRHYDKNKDKQFWWWLGIDQYAHHLTHYFLICLLLGAISS